MKIILSLIFLAIANNASAFNGEIETPTFVFSFRLPTLAAPNKPAGDTGSPGHINPDSPFQPPPFAPFGQATYIPTPKYVKNFLSQSVFIGDSITQSWDLKTYFGVSVANKGIGGQRTDQMLARFDRDVLSLHPRGVFIMGGINDAAQGYPVTFAEKNISAMVQKADAIHSFVFVGTLIPAVPANNTIPNLMTFVNTFNIWLKGYCNGVNCTTLNYSKAAGGPGFKFATHVDYIHPNNVAYHGMSRMVIHAVERKIGMGRCSHHRH